MNTLNDLKDGDLVTFKYKGEKDSVPRKRLVRIKGVDGTGTYAQLKSEDVLDGNQYKVFKTSGISPNSVRVVGDKNAVVKTGDEAASDFVKVSRKVQLAGLQEVVRNIVPNAESVVHDEELDTFIVKTKPPKAQAGFTVSVELNSDSEIFKTVLVFKNERGEVLDWDFTEQQNGVLRVESFVKSLAKHYGFQVSKQ